MKTNIILLRTILISGCSMVIQYGLTFILTPYITSSIGTDAYGYVSFSKSVVGYFELITVSLNSYATRYISVEYHKKNCNKANEYFNSVLFANILLGTVLLIIGGIFTSQIDIVFDIKHNILIDVKILFAIIFVNMFVNCLGTSFNAAAYIKNKLDVVGIFNFLSKMAQALVILVLFFTQKPHVAYVGVGIIINTLIITKANYKITKKYIPEFKINIRCFRLEYVKKLVISGLWNSINGIGNVLNSGLDLMISNLMLSAYSMGQLSIAKSFTSLFSAMFQLLSQPFQPLLLKAYSENDTLKLKTQIIYSMKLNGCFSNVIVSIIIVLGNDFFKLWIPNENYSFIYFLTILTVINAITEGPSVALYYVYTLTLKNKVPCIVNIIGGILNVLSMFILLKYTNLGLIAVVITTCIIMGFINLIVNPIYACRCINIKRVSFYKFLIRHIMSLGALIIFMYCLSGIIQGNNWGSLFFKGVVCIPAGIIIYVICVAEKRDYMLIKKWLRI